MARFDRQVKRNQAKERKKMAKRRMKEAAQAQGSATEAQLWQAKYDQKVEEVSMLKNMVNRNEALIAAIILDNCDDDTAVVTDETVQLIASGGIQGFNREQDEGGITIQVVLSPDVEEVDDDADVLPGQDEAQADDPADESDEE